MTDYDEMIATWKGLPYLYAALHWLSMSHACYNPVIYCWMNARFRSGFMAVLSRLPLIRRAMPETNQTCNTSVGIALAGTDNHHHHLHHHHQQHQQQNPEQSNHHNHNSQRTPIIIKNNTSRTKNNNSTNYISVNNSTNL